MPTGLPGSNGGRARRGRAYSSRFVPLQSADNIAAVAVAANLAVVGPAFTSSDHPDHPTPTVRRHATDACATIVSAVDDNVCCIDQKERRGGGPKLHLPFLPFQSYGGKAARIHLNSLHESLPRSPPRGAVKNPASRQRQVSKHEMRPMQVEAVVVLTCKYVVCI